MIKKPNLFMIRYIRLNLTVSILTVTLVLTTSSASVNENYLNPPQTGIASFYSYECADQPMANGKIFDPEKRTCASWFYEFGTVLTIRSLDTGRCTEAVVTDRGPNRRLVRKGRIIDLSRRAFQDICDLDKGLTRIEVRVK